MFNFSVCSFCARSSRVNGVAVGCGFSECRYEPIPTNFVNNTTSVYAVPEASNKTEEKKEDE